MFPVAEREILELGCCGRYSGGRKRRALAQGGDLSRGGG